MFKTNTCTSGFAAHYFPTVCKSIGKKSQARRKHSEQKFLKRGWRLDAPK